jgi:hypothetical protein
LSYFSVENFWRWLYQTDYDQNKVALYAYTSILINGAILLTMKNIVVLAGLTIILSNSSALAEELSVTRFTGPDENHYSYFINGLASAIPAIGYGLRDLSTNLGGKHYSYVTPLESTVPIQFAVIADIETQLTANPNARINLIGVSYGGNIATLIAQQLDVRQIAVNYLAIIDAPAPVSITSNVHRVDNFYCRRVGCIGQKIRLSQSNKSTIQQQFLVREKHIALSASPTVTERITGQLSETAMNVVSPDLPEPLLGLIEELE